MKDGDLGTGSHVGSRWCASCAAYHGFLYICDSYSVELKDRLIKNSEEFSNNLQDQDWVRRQLGNGVPPEAIKIFEVLSGVTHKNLVNKGE